MKIVILIPLGSQTGGPEAQHQLSHELIEQGHDAYVWYVVPSDIDGIKNLYTNGQLTSQTTLDIGERIFDIEEYKKYKVNRLTNINLSEEICFIIPEVYIEFVKYFHSAKHVVWWLSVDNAFGYLANGQVNLNHLRKSNCYHGYQSQYANNFLSAINLQQKFPLSDYTPFSNTDNFINDNVRNAISINAGNKVIFDVEGISKKLKELCNCEIRLLKNMTREQIYQSLESSRIYIDLAHFPGKDRMPREALLRNCCVLVANAGAGYGPDFGLPDEFHIDVNEIKTLPELAAKIFKSYDFYSKLCLEAANLVKRERLVFSREVSAMMSLIERV
jgi:hypothetical protein